MTLYIIVAFLVGAAVVLGSMLVMYRFIRETLPSTEDMSEILREQISEEFEMYLENIDALQELGEGEEE